MRIHNSLTRFIFCIAIFNVEPVLKAVSGSKNEIPSGDVNTKIPIEIDINYQKSTSECTYHESSDRKTITYHPQNDFAIQTVNSKGSKFTDSIDQKIYDADSPSKRAYKVIGYNLGIEGRKIEIYLYNGEVITFFRFQDSENYINQSNLKGSKGIGNNSENRMKRKARFAKSKGFLYCIIGFLSVSLAITICVGVGFIIRHKIKASRVHLTPDIMV